jgi:hypothetical protein
VLGGVALAGEWDVALGRRQGKAPSQPPKATASCPAPKILPTNTVKGSCEEFLARGKSKGTVDEDGHAEKGSVGKTTVHYTAQPTFTQTPSGKCWTATKVKSGIAGDIRIYRLQWDPTTCTCTKTVEEFYQKVKDHECHHYNDIVSVIALTNKNGLKGKSYKSCKKSKEAAKQDIQNQLNRDVQALIDKVVIPEVAKRAADFHKTPAGKAVPWKCPPCDACASGSSLRAEAMGTSCGDQCCGACEECREDACGCFPKTCPDPNCQTCNPATGECEDNGSCPGPTTCQPGEIVCGQDCCDDVTQQCCTDHCCGAGETCCANDCCGAGFLCHASGYRPGEPLCCPPDQTACPGVPGEHDDNCCVPGDICCNPGCYDSRAGCP